MCKLFYDLGVGLVSSFIFMILLFLKEKLMIYLNRDKLLARFNIYKNIDLLLCYGQVNSHGASPLETEFYGTPVILGDISSTLLVSNKLDSNVNNVSRFSYDIPNNEFKGNVVSIGGPRWNKQTEKLLGKLGSPLYFKEGVKSLIKIDNGQEVFLKYEIRKEKDLIEMTDYGIIVCGKNGYIKGASSCVVIAGYTVFGVLFASEAFSNPSKEFVKFVNKKSKSIKSDSRFAICVKGTVKINKDGTLASKVELSDYKLISEEDFLPSNDYSYLN